MGFGDVKLMAMAGAFLGPVLTLFVLCTASMLGGAIRNSAPSGGLPKAGCALPSQAGTQAASRAWRAAQIAMRGLEIPFGVFLCIVSIVTWFYGAQMIQAYLRLFRIPG